MTLAEPIYPPLVMPDSVERERVTIHSNGIALDGDLYRPSVARDAAPAVVLCHGWGGSKRTCERYASLFAEAGMIAVCFTQATWFGSGPQLRIKNNSQPLDGPGSPEIFLIRDLVDPFDWIQNLQAAIDYLEGEPGVDRNRIGAFGTSFGGGVAMYCAANDPRIHALSVQVANVAPLDGELLKLARRRAVDSARGNYDPIDEGFLPVPGLPGFANIAKWSHYNVLAQLDHLSVPTLMVDAAEEEMLSISQNCGRAYEILRERHGQIVRYEVIPGIDHYGIYFAGYDQGSALSLDWFKRHL